MASAVRDELLDVVRAACGGLLFGVPLLYTMEVWWLGTHSQPREMALVLLLLTVPVFALNLTAGFRAEPDVTARDAAADTIQAIAISVVVAAAVLALLQEVDLDTPRRALLGKVLYESVPVCLGVGVARHFLRGDRAGPLDEPPGDDDGGGEKDDEGADPAPGTLADFGATSIGAVFIALSIAPTDEVPLIASALGPPALLGLMVASLVASYAIVFVAGFVRQDQRHEQRGAFQRPVTETLVSYLLALVVAGLLLWAFQRGLEPWRDLLARTIVLGFPAAIGGAAGRLAL